MKRFHMRHDPLQRLRAHLELARAKQRQALDVFRLAQSRHERLSERAIAKADLVAKEIQLAKEGRSNRRKINAAKHQLLKLVRAILKNLLSAIGSHKSINFWDGQIMVLEYAISELKRDRMIRYQWWRESEECGPAAKGREKTEKLRDSPEQTLWKERSNYAEALEK